MLANVKTRGGKPDRMFAFGFDSADQAYLIHASHIGRVGMDFHIAAPSLNPNEVTTVLGIQPDKFAMRGDERRNFAIYQIDGMENEEQSIVPSRAKPN